MRGKFVSKLAKQFRAALAFIALLTCINAILPLAALAVPQVRAKEFAFYGSDRADWTVLTTPNTTRSSGARASDTGYFLLKPAASALPSIIGDKAATISDAKAITTATAFTTYASGDRATPRFTVARTLTQVSSSSNGV